MNCKLNPLRSIGWNYLFIPNFNLAAVDEVWEWIGDMILHFTMRLITYPCWDLSYSMLAKRVPCCRWIINAETKSLFQATEPVILIHLCKDNICDEPMIPMGDIVLNHAICLSGNVYIDHWLHSSYTLRYFSICQVEARHRKIKIRSPAAATTSILCGYYQCYCLINYTIYFMWSWYMLLLWGILLIYCGVFIFSSRQVMCDYHRWMKYTNTKSQRSPRNHEQCKYNWVSNHMPS